MTASRWLPALCLCVAFGLSGCRKSGEGEHGEDEKGEHAAEPVAPGHAAEVHLTAEAVDRSGIRVGKIERRALAGGVAIPAEVEFDPTSTAHVGPLVSGRITKVAVALGDQVKKNQLLGVVASSDVSEARARLDQARARLSAAESTLARQQQLASEGIGAQRALIEAEAQVGQLRAEANGLQRQLAVYGAGGGGQLELRAPIAGVVVQLHATIGDMASAEEPAFVVTDPSKVSVRGNVPELEIVRVQRGMPVIVRLHAFPDAVLSGTITYIAPALDHDSRALPIRVTLTAPDPRLRSGLFGGIELVGGKQDERVLSVPAEAVATLDGQTVVFVAGDEPNSFRPAPVVLGRRAGAWFELKRGPNEGAPVVVSGAFTLKSALRSGELSEGHEH